VITRLQFVVLCRVEQGLPAFTRPLAPKTHPQVLSWRRAALEDLYARQFLERVHGRGPRVTITGRRVLNWIRTGAGECPYDDLRYGVGKTTLAARVHRIRRAMSSGTVEPTGVHRELVPGRP